MPTTPRQLPLMPEIGRPESYYAKLVKQADESGDLHGHEAAKVGQYVTLAIDPHLEWDQKLRYFQHVLRRHCAGPGSADERVESFYKKLAHFVRAHAGQEALRLASTEDDLYATRIGLGTPREQIDEEAEVFFANLLGHQDDCPAHFNPDDWTQLKMLRDQWI